MKAIWEYIHGYASVSDPELITFYDTQDQALYRDLPLEVIGQHGWELVTVLATVDPKSGESRREYYFKRNRSEGYEPGIGAVRNN